MKKTMMAKVNLTLNLKKDCKNAVMVLSLLVAIGMTFGSFAAAAKANHYWMGQTATCPYEFIDRTRDNQISLVSSAPTGVSVQLKCVDQ